MERINKRMHKTKLNTPTKSVFRTGTSLPSDVKIRTLPWKVREADRYHIRIRTSCCSSATHMPKLYALS